MVTVNNNTNVNWNPNQGRSDFEKAASAAAALVPGGMLVAGTVRAASDGVQFAVSVLLGKPDLPKALSAITAIPMAPLQSLADLIQIGAPAIGSIAGGAAGTVGKAVEGAVQNFDSDVASAVFNWALKGDNLMQAAQFGAQIAKTVGAAVASGGTSLAVDLPALAASAFVIVDEIATEAGMPLGDLIGKGVTEALVAVGVSPEDAAKIGPFVGSATVAGVQIAAAVQSGDFSKVSPQALSALARDGAVLLGADPKVAGAVSTAVGAGASLGLALAGGNSQLLNSGNLQSLLTSGESIAGLLAGADNGKLDIGKLMGEGKNFLGLLDKVIGNLESDTNTTGLRKLIGDKAGEAIQAGLKDLGPIGGLIAMGAQAFMQGQFGQSRSTV